MTEGHNGQLKAIVERIENISAEIKGLSDDRSDIYKEAKGNGFDVPALRAIIARRAKDQAKLEALEQMVETYSAALV